MKVVKHLFYVVIYSVLIYLIVGELIMPKDAPQRAGAATELETNWQIVLENGERIPKNKEYLKQVDPTEMITFETVLPDDLEDDQYLCFRVSRQDVELYIDGELRESYQKSQNSLFGNHGTALLYFLKVNAGDAGKMLTLRTQMTYQNDGIFTGIYYGDYPSIWSHYFLESFTEVVFAFTMLLLGAITIIATWIVAIKYHLKRTLIYIGWEVVLAALWMIGNSNLRQLIYPNLAVANDINFYMVMLFPIPILLFMDEIQEGRYHKRYQFSAMLSMAVIAYCVTMNMLQIKEYAATFPVAAVGLVTMMVLVIFGIFQDILTGKIQEYRIFAIGIFGALLAGGLRVAIYLNNYGYVNNDFLMVGGVALVLSTAVIDTAKKAMEREKKQTMLISVSKAKTRFFAHISHEIRTPINAILGMDNMIIRESSESRIREYAVDIQNAGRHLMSLVNDILDFSKLESGKMQIVEAEYSLQAMVHDIMNLISIKAQEKDLNFEVDIDPELPCRLYGDDVRIKQVLVNLLGNAVKYTEKGTVRMAIYGITTGEKVRLHISVKDSGIGIKDEQIEKLFRAFERLDEQVNHHVEGTGLGLSISKQLLFLMHSELHVESTYGKGSEFYFDLEQRIVDETPVGEIEEQFYKKLQDKTYTKAFVGEDISILVVDDNDLNLKVFKGLLKETGVQIDEAISGEKGLELTEKKAYDLIFLDHMMPGMDGIETLQKLREREKLSGKHSIVIALTANVSVGAREFYKSAGFDDFLAKPMEPEKLEQMILLFLPEKCAVQSKGIEREKPMENQKTVEELEKLPRISGIDWNSGFANLNSVDLLLNTARKFYEISAREAGKLEEQYAVLDQGSEAIKAYRVQVHSMKSSARLIGAGELSAKAASLEEAARLEQVDILKADTDTFLKEWRELSGGLAVLAVPEKPKQKFDPDMVLAYINDMDLAFEDLDVDRMDSLMERLLAYEYPDSLEESIKSLATLVTELNQEEGSVVIAGIRNRLLNS